MPLLRALGQLAASEDIKRYKNDAEYVSAVSVQGENREPRWTNDLLTVFLRPLLLSGRLHFYINPVCTPAAASTSHTVWVAAEKASAQGYNL